MNIFSIIDVLKAKLNRQKTLKPEPVNKEKRPKTAVLMTEEQLAERERIRTLLLNGISIIEFTKVDGTKAIMQCTLDPTLLPPVNTNESTRPEQNHLLHVYSIDRQGWRSFLVNNVIRIY